jgi:hypothetical protein
MSGDLDLTETERQLLMAAAVHRLGPGTDLGRANTARIVNEVLGWRGLNSEQIESGWRDEGPDPAHQAVYTTLVHMTHQMDRDGPGRAPQRPGPALFEGAGNCGLTAEGERVARLLLEQNPEV